MAILQADRRVRLTRPVSTVSSLPGVQQILPGTSKLLGQNVEGGAERVACERGQPGRGGRPPPPAGSFIHSWGVTLSGSRPQFAHTQNGAVTSSHSPGLS